MPTWTPNDWRDGWTRGEWLAVLALPVGTIAWTLFLYLAVRYGW
jgi:hypothetical protein